MATKKKKAKKRAVKKSAKKKAGRKTARKAGQGQRRPAKKTARKVKKKTSKKKTATKKKTGAKKAARKKVAKKVTRKAAKKKAARKVSKKAAGRGAKKKAPAKSRTSATSKKTSAKKTAGSAAAAGKKAGPRVGQKIKDFELPVAGAPGDLLPGGTRRLSELAGPAGLVLYFYPKDSTPGCTVEACEFRDNLARLNATGFQPVGVSADSIASHQKFAARQSLNFPLIADEEKIMLSELGLWVEKSMYGRVFMGIPRTTLILDRNLVVRRVYEKVSPKGHVDQILSDIAQLS